MFLQALMGKKLFEPIDFTWLDKLEEARWGDPEANKPLPPEHHQRNLLALVRAGKFIPPTPS